MSKRFSISNKRRLQLIDWLKKKYFAVPENLPLAKLMWRKGNNKALDDVIALLEYQGDYVETPVSEIIEEIMGDRAA